MLQALENNEQISAYKAIGEVSRELGIEPHVIRYWETQFSQIKPVKRRGGRRYYRATDVENLEKIHHLLHIKGYTIKGARQSLNLENQAFMAKFPKPDPNTIDMFGGSPAVTEISEKKISKPKAVAAPAPEANKFDANKNERLLKILGELQELKKLTIS